MRLQSECAALVIACAITIAQPSDVLAQAQTPVTGHYPPGQSGIRGAATPASGFVYTNFNRLFSNLELRSASGDTVRSLDEVRFANISMFAWTTDLEILGMRYGALAGVPFSTGNLRPTADDTESSGLGLGDVLLTPLALYGASAAFDYQVQLTWWTASGRFSPGAHDNRGTGFTALVYSLGGVFYPRGNRNDWSLSAIARIEQNFEQDGSGITPGDDVVIDWGIGKIVHIGGRPIDLGVSGFGVWQITSQQPSSSDLERYRYFGIGPEASASIMESLSLRVRAQWEFGGRNVVIGNNLWIIFALRL